MGAAACPDVQAVKAFLAAEPAKAAEVQALRLRNAELQHRIAALEQRLKDTDRLSGALGARYRGGAVAWG